MIYIFKIFCRYVRKRSSYFAGLLATVHGKKQNDAGHRFVLFSAVQAYPCDVPC